MSDAEIFEIHRQTLFGLAYRMLGSASEAEDVVQDAFLRFMAAPQDEIRSHRAYLSTVVTRLCLDRLKAARVTREHYLGPWLPEPLIITDEMTEPQHAAEQLESITLAFLVLLEVLTPQERAVFLLREVFAYEYAEIAEVLQLSLANCRQLFHRAKERIAGQRSRFHPVSEHHRQLVMRFLAATQQGNMQALTQLLAQDITLWADGGEQAQAPRKPVHGRVAVVKVLRAFKIHASIAVGDEVDALDSTITTVNGELASLAWLHGRLDTIMIISIADRQISALRLIRNPEKLDYIRRQLLECAPG